MSIKPDKWIRRMCQQHGMIEPFSPELVREVNGQKIVSYGTSSYGYDIRCADEFRLPLTPATSATRASLETVLREYALV